MGLRMRRRLKNFLPIVLIALVVQIFAPIGACWAASIAASDPLATAVICHGNAGSTSGPTDQTGHRAHEGCCSVCSVLQTGAPVDVPLTAEAASVDLKPLRVVWVEFTPDRFASRAGSHAQARAPPLLT
jgi:hypothetical protein